MPIRVRPLTQDDLPELSAWLAGVPLWRRYRLTAAGLYGQLRAALAAGEVLLVADAGGVRAAGLAWCVPRGMFGRSPYLRLFGVRPELAGQGVGGRLLAELERALGPGADLFLLVAEFNAAAQRFYERRGFARVGEIPGYALPEVAELLYRKRLTSAVDEANRVRDAQREREEP